MATTPGVRSCWTVWHKAYPEIPKGNMNDDIEEQGPVQGWCQEIHLFAQAATAAGKNLNRRTFVTAMSKITNFPGGYSPILTYGPDKFYGPTQYQVVRLHATLPEHPVPPPHRQAAPAGALLDHGPDVEAPAEGELMAATHASEKASWETDGWCLLEALLARRCRAGGPGRTAGPVPHG